MCPSAWVGDKAVTTLGSYVRGTAAVAAPCNTDTTVGNQTNNNKSSTVDPKATSNVSPGACASAATVTRPKTEQPKTAEAGSSGMTEAFFEVGGQYRRNV